MDKINLSIVNSIYLRYNLERVSKIDPCIKKIGIMSWGYNPMIIIFISHRLAVMLKSEWLSKSYFNWWTANSLFNVIFSIIDWPGNWPSDWPGINWSLSIDLNNWPVIVVHGPVVIVYGPVVSVDRPGGVVATSIAWSGTGLVGPLP